MAGDHPQLISQRLPDGKAETPPLATVAVGAALDRCRRRSGRTHGGRPRKPARCAVRTTAGAA